MDAVYVLLIFCCNKEERCFMQLSDINLWCNQNDFDIIFFSHNSLLLVELKLSKTKKKKQKLKI